MTNLLNRQCNERMLDTDIYSILTDSTESNPLITLVLKDDLIAYFNTVSFDIIIPILYDYTNDIEYILSDAFINENKDIFKHNESIISAYTLDALKSINIDKPNYMFAFINIDDFTAILKQINY